MNKKSGEGMIFKKDGSVMKGDFRNNFMEGPFDNVTKVDKMRLKKVFNNAHRTNNVYIAINKKTEVKVQSILQLANQTNKFFGGGKGGTSPLDAGTRNLLMKM